MAQNNEVAKLTSNYTRVDFAALRAYLQRVPVASFIHHYYTEDDLYERGLDTEEKLAHWLNAMCSDIAQRALLAYPHIAQTLADARQTGFWGRSLVNFLVNYGEKDFSKPVPTDPLSVWFKPQLAQAFAQDGIISVRDLKECLQSRGPNWWRPIPRIGPGKASVIQAWLQKNAGTLGELRMANGEARSGNLILLGGQTDLELVPLEQVQALAPALDGSLGRNRNNAFCLIAAKNDLEAVHAYLYRYRGRDLTYRAYRKELERFLLWCVLERRLALSSVLTEDCEAYKNFLADIPDSWVGRKVSRKSAAWKPFASQLEPESQRYAVQVLRTFFEWLVNVRYLSGNTWHTVPDPAVARKELPLRLEKALPQQLWEALSLEGGLLDRVSDGEVFRGERKSYTSTLLSQYRLARAAILLIGYSGLRRAEAANAVRNNLKPVPGADMWELAVLGKRNKWRTVFLPNRAIAALRAHWDDRGHDFDDATSEMALISPVVVPSTPLASAKHLDASPSVLTGNGYSPDGLARMVKDALLRLSLDQDINLTLEDRSLLRDVAPHALRHTFASAAVETVSLEGVRDLMGHASLSTTSIYVRAQRKRNIEELSKLFSKSTQAA